ncbi:MAG: hypothetical protein NTV01_07865 [Bacteroidia bacterium]|nr:hypothetical protein [Bacteroidia bacterium]
MMSFRRTFLLVLYKLSDIIILFISLALALSLARNLDMRSNLIDSFHTGMTVRQFIANLTDFFHAGMNVKDFIAIIIVAISWHILFRLIGLYETTRFRRKFKVYTDILKATFLGTFIISVIANAFYEIKVISYFVLVFWVSATTLTILMRMSMRMILHIMRAKGLNLRNMVVVGINEKAIRFVKKIRKHKDIGYNIVGFVDNECIANGEPVALLSDLNHFEDILNRQVIDEVVIALPAHSFYREISKILYQCAEQGLFLP